MATTPRLGLYKPNGFDLVDVEAHLNEQLDVIDDKAFRTLVSNEASPPVAEFTGQEWFTKDSKKWFFWTGSVWKEIPFPVDTGSSVATGTGKKALTIGTHTTDLFTTGPNQENGPLFPTTVTTVEGKYYRVVVNTIVTSLDTTDPARYRVNIRAAIGNTVSNTGTLIASSYIAMDHFNSSDAKERLNVTIQGFFNSVGNQQTTFGVFLQKTSGYSGSVAFADINTPTPHYQAMWVEEL